MFIVKCDTYFLVDILQPQNRSAKDSAFLDNNLFYFHNNVDSPGIVPRVFSHSCKNLRSPAEEVACLLCNRII